jgi:hypothetical protein
MSSSRSVCRPLASLSRWRASAAGECARASAEFRRAWGADRVLLRLLGAFTVAQVVAMFWDQPSSYGWENDGVAPRDFFGGIAANLTPGAAHRYPLLHYLVIGLNVLWVVAADWTVALATGAPLRSIVISVPSMTLIALSTKALHHAMTCVSLLALGRIVRFTFGVRPSHHAVAFAMLNVSVAYYGRTTNVDAAYLMWVCLWVDRLLLWQRNGSRRQLTCLALFAAAAMATKDQAYAAFILPGLVFLLILPLRAPVSARAEHFRALAGAVAQGAAAYALLSGALFNPTGFVRRLALLAGPNSAGWRQYEPSIRGLATNAADLVSSESEFWWPWPVVLIGWFGVVLAPRWHRRPKLASDAERSLWSWLPLLSGISSTVAFTLLVGRSEHRFLLPLGFWLSAYVGLGMSVAIDRCRSVLRARAGASLARWVVTTLTALPIALAAFANAELWITQLYDPRRDVERFLARLQPASRVETYGLGVYLPRFGAPGALPYQVTRVSAAGSGVASPIPNVRDIEADYADLESRRPDVLVVPEGFANRFRVEHGQGFRNPVSAMTPFRQGRGALAFFRAALDDRLPNYRLLDIGRFRPPAWYDRLGGHAIAIHGSTGGRVWVLQRVGSRPLEP